MTTREIYDWICSAPMLDGEKVNIDYLPACEGWSMSMPKSATHTDVIGNIWESAEISITHRISVSGNADRIALLEQLDALRRWAKQNPPEGCRVIFSGMPKLKSRSAAGTEDLVLTLKIEE